MGRRQQKESQETCEVFKIKIRAFGLKGDEYIGQVRSILFLFKAHSCLTKKNKTMRKLIFVFAFANALFNAKAQNDSTRTLKEVIVSASRYDQKILETPRSVTVINSDAIRNSVYNSVGDLLSKQPGIYIVGSNQTPGTNQSLFMRGANSNQVVVLMDGVRITDPSSPNNAIDLSELSLTNIKR